MSAPRSDSSIIVVDSYFCGRRHHDDGPYVFHVQQGRITAITATPVNDARPVAAITANAKRAAFLMPGLVEAHCHLFLDGTASRPPGRKAGRLPEFAGMMAVGERNLRLARSRGISLIRDAGDRYGINDEIRARIRRAPDNLPAIRSPGMAIRRAGSYGKFMALEVATPEEAVDAVDRLAAAADDIKIILTGIVDFPHMAVTQEPQFDAKTLRRMVACAHRHGRPVFVHCSGLAGIELAIEAGVDSIEHGYFINADLLKAMADRAIAWVPTVAPVHFQWAHPEIAGWPPETIGNLRRILDAHLEHIALADQLGVRLIAGSDAGSPGVMHGCGLIDEIFFFMQAGLTMTRALAAATSVPRHHWGYAWADLRPGSPGEFLVLGASPFDEPGALRGESELYSDGRAVEP